MEDEEAATSPEKEPSPRWKFSARRSRKSGCSNIFAGVNLTQLRRLFQAAGEGDAEHRAKLVWGGADGGGMEGAEDVEKEEKEEEEEAGLARALVGLRVRARRGVGIRAEGHREPRWLRAFGHLRIKEQSAGQEGDEGDPDPRPGAPPAGAGVLEHQMACEGPLLPTGKTSMWKQEWARDPERYLHRVLH